MRDYGKVFSRIWESADFRSLSEDGRMLAMYLLTCQHGTIAGVFRVPDGYACEDLQWSSERVTEGFAELSANGFATRCEATKWVWVAKYLDWNQPENPNQRKACAKIASQVPNGCAWKRAFMRVCGPILGMEDMPEVEPLPNPLPTVSQPVLGTVAVTGVGTGAGTVVTAATTVAPAMPAAAAAAKRGSRLDPDFVLPKLWVEWAQGKYPHWTADTVRAVAAKFRNYWVAKAGKDATKLDWRATWENWCDSGITQAEHPPPKADTAARQLDASLAKAQRLQAAMRAAGLKPAAETLGAHE